MEDSGVGVVEAAVAGAAVVGAAAEGQRFIDCLLSLKYVNIWRLPFYTFFMK